MRWIETRRGGRRREGRVGSGGETYGDGAAGGLGGGGDDEESEGEYEEIAGGADSPWIPVGRMRRRPERHGAV